MNRNELIKLRKLVSEEVERRQRIEELLKNELVKEYLKLTNSEICKLDSNNIQNVIRNILNSFTIKETNGIYVCTKAYYIDSIICYETTDIFSHYVKINSEHAEHKVYTDIESGVSINASKEETKSCLDSSLINDFEQNNIVLNPYNACENLNGYDEVRMFFFENALKYGQAKSKKLVLAKYPRI